MQLNYRQYSDQGKPLIILHGLFGSLANWGWHCKQLAGSYAVVGVDLRNHGDSPHTNEMSYSLMAEDVKQLMGLLQLDDCLLIGHSMGGKVAMQLALSHPQLVSKLIVVDIAPVTYPDSADGHLSVLAGMQSLDISNLDSRKDAEQQMAKFIEDEATRKFVMMNLVRNSEGQYGWRLNLAAIMQHYGSLREKPLADRPFTKPVLFVKGAESNYIQQRNRAEIMQMFPAATVKIIMHAGHWLHAEKPQAFQTVALGFLQDDDSKDPFLANQAIANQTITNQALEDKGSEG